MDMPKHEWPWGEMHFSRDYVCNCTMYYIIDYSSSAMCSIGPGFAKSSKCTFKISDGVEYSILAYSASTRHILGYSLLDFLYSSSTWWYSLLDLILASTRRVPKNLNWGFDGPELNSFCSFVNYNSLFEFSRVYLLLDCCYLLSDCWPHLSTKLPLLKPQ